MENIRTNHEHLLARELLKTETNICFLSTEGVIRIHWQIFARGQEPHDENLTKFVGDIDRLRSAVHKPMQAVSSNPEMAAEDAACLLAQAIIQNHPFVDGNKRAGLFAMIKMLKVNGFELLAEPTDIVHTIRGFADGRVSESAFLEWVKDNVCASEYPINQNRQRLH